MALDSRKFFQACNPSRTLKMELEEDRDFYIDFSSVRGGTDIIKQLLRTITLAANDSSCQLFTGHLGCGKSTELFRLKDELEKQQFHVVYFESDADMDMADVDISDILLTITRQVSESLEKVGIKLKPSYFTDLFNEVANFLQTPLDFNYNAELSLPLGIGKITAKTKESPKLRSQLREYLEPRTSGILEAINKEVLGRTTELLKKEGYKGLVVIVDNLDRIDISRKSSGRSQPEYLFIDRGEQLRKLNCHVVYTIPLVLIFSNELNSLINRFGVKPAVLPMVTVRNRDRSDHVKGMELLRQMVLARAFPKLSREERLENILGIFDSPEVLDRLCRMSGGHVRNLLVLLYSCLQREDPPLDSNCLESVIKEYRDDLIAGIEANEWSLLKQIVQEKDIVKGETEYQTLLRSMFLFEYRDDEGRWFDVNPAIAESKKLQP